ncbi:ATP-binding protein [Aeromicrobium sp. CnD17-E]|uniref:ATP-binding protein n=1 Tax=Aeromicrobium sp. CnD17-E TaxID=2954487 RepID=UPI002097E1F5|nr:ATP-binding protein [Aeromicrobium sp. CnD17-E]MCO7237921.1 ATP-binding protein [Aeromicrobium sp. CnD17-E]
MDCGSISIRPGVGMLNLFPHMKYQPWYALGELVDNAIQSYVANRDALRDVDGVSYQLRIEIQVDKADGGSIAVRDNAAGISSVDWPRAFRVADPPADQSGLSQFGVGMKAACCWFARRWSVRSSNLGEHTTREVSFDVPAIVESRDETLVVVESAEAAQAHFTEVRMEGLYRVPQTKTLAKIREYLGGIYRQFIRNDDVLITFNGDPLVFEEPPVLEAPHYKHPDSEPVVWRKDVDLRLESGRRVKGFVGIRERGATATAGIALFYRNKVVSGAGEETFRPEEIFGRSNSFRSQRVFGEMHMDDFNVTYTKDALVWYDEEDEFLRALKAELDREPMPLLKQAENYRSRTVPPAPPAVARDLLDNIIRSFGEIDPGSGTAKVVVVPPGPDNEAAPVEPSASEMLQADRELVMDVDGKTWKVSFQLVADEANQDWITVREYGGVEPEVVIKVNQAHPFMRAYCELPGDQLEPVWRVAIALGLGQAIARAGGASLPGLVIRNANALLRTYLSSKA